MPHWLLKLARSKAYITCTHVACYQRSRIIILLKRLGACEQHCPNTWIQSFKGKTEPQLGIASI
jgi:hypothetical protein